MGTPLRILVARTDKLGDFMLTWPAVALLRQALPEARIDLLVSGAVEEMARACPYVGEVIVDRGQTLRSIVGEVRRNRYDSALALFVTGRVGMIFMAARIPYRLTPATKVAQFLFNQRLIQRRSRSEQPEHAYNSDLVRRCLADHGIHCPPAPRPPYLRFGRDALGFSAADLRERYGIPAGSGLVVIHPGSGGSAKNLSTAQYARLGNALGCADSLFILVTAGPGERKQAEEVSRGITAHATAVHESREGLVAFARVLAVTDMFISGSTGPLHIAGALDVPTVGFYPRRISSTALRWQTTNSEDRRLAFSPPASADEVDMSAIDVGTVAAEINRKFLQMEGR